MYNQGKMGLIYSETQYADICIYKQEFLLNPDIQEGIVGRRVCPDPAQGVCCVLLSISCTCCLFFALEFNAKLYRLYRNLDVPVVLMMKKVFTPSLDPNYAKCPGFFVLMAN